MYRKFVLLLVSALLFAGALSFAVFAKDVVAYLGFNGNNANDGLSDTTPKKSFDAEGTGVVGIIPNGGTVVACQKAYFGGNYTLNLGGPVTITGNYDGKDYKNPEPAENPAAGVFKMASGATLTLLSDLVLDDIIVFQENAQNTILVCAGVTFMVTDSCVLMTKPGNDYHFKVVLEAGATAILSETAQETFEIVNIGGTGASAGTEIKMTIGDMNGYVNGEAKVLDAAPIIRQSRTMLPVRFVAENLGAVVAWDGAASTATITSGTTEIKITIGAAAATVNGEVKPLDAPAFIENSRTYLPVRFVAEALGATVAWDGATSTATITVSPDATMPETPNEPWIPGTTPKSMKVLAIGNSFSTDAMQYLAQIAHNLGVEEVVLGNLYIGGCSLDTHYSHAKLGDGAYTYYKTATGVWSATEKATLLDGLRDEEWDVITLQQTSRTCGLPSSYRSLPGLVAFVEENKPASARLAWHMTWAYQQDSTHSSFPNYKNDQMTMYDMIVSTLSESVDTQTAIVSVIPVGTSVQNARTGFIGDTLTRDGHHLSYRTGRLLAGMTWYAALTGCSVDSLTYNPDPGEITDDVMALLKESVSNAIQTPRAVTASLHTTGKIGHTGVLADDVILEPEDFYEADCTLAAANGVDLSGYTLYPWRYQENAYWFCTRHANIITPAEGTSTYCQNVSSAEMHSRSELPVGTVVICDSGWQYRPERWLENKTASTRPGMADGFVLIDEAWWGNNAWCAFNLSSSPKTDLSVNYAAAAAHLRIYVPKDSSGQ